MSSEASHNVIYSKTHQSICLWLACPFVFLCAAVFVNFSSGATELSRLHWAYSWGIKEGNVTI